MCLSKDLFRGDLLDDQWTLVETNTMRGRLTKPNEIDPERTLLVLQRIESFVPMIKPLGAKAQAEALMFSTESLILAQDERWRRA